jgi:hypothetical protein
MRLKFFRVPVDGGAAENELGSFLASHKVLEVDRQFVANGFLSFWAICVVYLDGNPAAAAGKMKIDYREVLAPAEFELYSQLRNLRKNLAERDAVPAIRAAAKKASRAGGAGSGIRTVDWAPAFAGVTIGAIARFGRSSWSDRAGALAYDPTRVRRAGCSGETFVGGRSAGRLGRSSPNALRSSWISRS